ncbi:MAG: hypothetical protein JWM64_1760 [Frankiales bacterium]|nr:hypothetical protein [Frankiales bacterium]
MTAVVEQRRAARPQGALLRPAGPSEPWVPRDAVRLLLCQVVGLFVLLGAWAGVAGSSRLSHQYAWTSLAVVGFLVAASGTGTWLLTGRRAVGVRLQELLASHEVTRDGYAGSAPADERPPVPRAEPAVRTGALVSVPGAERYHRDGCVLVRGKSAVVAERAEHERAGRRPCELCSREQGTAA